MRSKEDAADYRYFPDPDLPPLVIAPEWVERVRGEMPELPALMSARFQADYGLPVYDAAMMTQSLPLSALLRGGRQGLQPAQAGGQLVDGRGVAAAERRREIDRRQPGQRSHLGDADRPHQRRHDLQQRRQAGVRSAVERPGQRRRCTDRPPRA
jgi:Glu-tRNA(Gln) amidotransferase subunit E-like FAD-binding protein